MKKIFLFVSILCLFQSIRAQNCFQVISDLSGLDISNDLEDLENAACALIEAFPVEYQSQFKVYDFGFYSSNEFMQGGFEGIWEDNILPNIASQTPYYLAFGRQISDSKNMSKLWVKVKLPETDWLEMCYDKPYIQVLNTSIKNKFEEFSQLHNIPYIFPDAMIEGMKSMKNEIQNLSDCCQPENTNFNSEECEGCITSEDVYNELINMGFVPHYNCTVLDTSSNHDCLCTSSEASVTVKSSKTGGGRSDVVIDSANYLIVMDGIEYDLYAVLNDAGQEIPDFKAMISKNDNFCNLSLFEDFENNYNNNENAAWIHIWENPINNDEDVLMIKYKLSSNASPDESFNAFESSIIQAQPDFKYKITQRSFAPWDRFGHLPILPWVHVARNSFHGDNRGFSLDKPVVGLNSTDGVTARLNQYIKFDLKGEKLDAQRFSSTTKGYKNFVRKIPATHLEPEKILSEQEDQQLPSGYETVEKQGLNNKVRLFVQGSDPLITPLIPGVSWFTPDIECLLFANLFYIKAESSLYVHCSLFYKEFPAYEAFIEDECGNKVFLHTMSAPCESSLGGELLNPGWDYHRFFDFKIPVNEEGCFMSTITELYINRLSYTISEVEEFDIDNWNSSHLSKNPATDCLSIPCQGAYPNNGEDLRSEFNCEIW